MNTSSIKVRLASLLTIAKARLVTLSAVAKTGVTAVYRDARARAALGAGISGGLALIGLHVSPDTIFGIMSVGAALGGLGPHTSMSDE